MLFFSNSSFFSLIYKMNIKKELTMTQNSSDPHKAKCHKHSQDLTTFPLYMFSLYVHLLLSFNEV